MRRFVLLAALAVFAALLASCDMDGITEYYSDQWYEYDTSRLADIKIPVGTSDTDDAAATKEIAIAGLYAYFNQSSGLRLVVAQGTSASDYAKPVYGEKTYSTEEFSAAKWIALVELGNLRKCGKPDCIGSDLYLNLSDITDKDGGIQWKKVLTNILIGKLLEE